MNAPATRCHASRGFERVAPQARLSRSQSIETSVIVVLRGAIDQACYRARERLEEGAVVIRPLFDCHTMRCGGTGAELLHLPWNADLSLGASFDGVDVGKIMAVAASDPEEARRMIEDFLRRAQPRKPSRRHLVDQLREELVLDPNLSIADWAERHAISREGLSRSFRAAYQVSASRFRMEIRARHAWKRVVSSTDTLGRIAEETGFANPAHMTRGVAWLTGHPPSAWRAAEDRRGGGLSRAIAGKRLAAPLP